MAAKVGDVNISPRAIPLRGTCWSHFDLHQGRPR